MKITDAESRWVAVWGQGWGLTAAGYKGSLYGDRTAPYLNWGERYVAAYVLFWPGHVAGGMFPDQGLNPCPLHLEHEDLTTGTPGKSQSCIHCKKAWNYTATKANFICKLEAWTIKKAECRRIDAFKLWCERRLLRVPWTARSSNTYATTSEEPLEKTLMLGKTEGRRGREHQEDEMAEWHHWLNGQKFEQTPGDSKGQGSLACCCPWGRKEWDMT